MQNSLATLLNSFSNSKDVSLQAECGVQPDLGGIMETHSPLAFIEATASWEAAERRGAGQCPVDLRRGAILKMSLETIRQ